MSTETRVAPPHNSEAEEGLLGSLLLGADIKSLTLTAKDFYFETNQIIYSCCLGLASKGIDINEITLAESLQRQGKLEVVGGVSQLSLLIAHCPSPLDSRWYADIIQRLAVYRQMIAMSDKIAQIGYEAKGELQNNLSAIDDMLLSLRKSTGNVTIISPQDVADWAFQRYNTLKNEEYGAALPTGLRDLDEQLGGGFYKGEMVIVAGRPGMGKTELSLNIANNAAIRGNVLFCSAEMSLEGLVDRIVAGQLGVSVHAIRRGEYEDILFDRMIGKPLQSIRDSNIYYFHDLPMTTSKILQAVVSMKARYGVALVVIDYLGILDDEYGSSGYERVGYISRKIKQIARVMDVPVLAVHQLNREVEHMQDKRPQLKDLRDSGKLEEDADVVLLIYRDSYYNENTENTRTDIIIAKHRQGTSNQIVGVYYDREHRLYKDLEERYELR